jgi:biopolymer transport protein ExbD
MHFASRGRGRKKGLNFELNLVPFIDVLSVCICFLLVTAVFINLGSIHVSQAVGSEADKSQKQTGSVTVSLGSGGDVRFEAKGVKGISQDFSLVTIKGAGGKINYTKTEEWIRSFSSRFTSVKTVMMMPNPTSKYDDLIQLMAMFKKNSMDQIGIAPL